MKKTFFLLIIVNLTWTLTSDIAMAYADKQTATVNFYSEEISIDYDSSMDITLGKDMSKQTFEKFYYNLNHTNYHLILGKLLYYKKKLALNDWFHYLLIRNCVFTIFKDKSENYKHLICWFLLNKAGCVVQLNYIGSEILLSVLTDEKIYNMPIREADNGWYVDITAYHRKKVQEDLTAFNSNIEINTTGRKFSFLLTSVPTLTNPKIVTKNLSFVHDQELHQIQVSCNQSFMQMMDRYPELSIKNHTLIPLSDEAYTSTILGLREKIKDLSNYESIRYLLSFTRKSLQYETDYMIHRVKNLTFSAEETLYHKYSDCEDRSILFYYLVKELLGLEVILVDYPDHATTAVLLSQSYGQKPIVYNNNNYTICDPTGPGNHLKPGDFPNGLQKEEYAVIEY